MQVLVTGGAGYIGSHTCLELLQAGHEVIVVDNFSNSKFTAVQRVEAITQKAIAFKQGDVRDRDFLQSVFSEYSIDAVIHFAGLKAVGESVAQPLRYYDNNVGGSIALAEIMAEHGVKTIVFSSSATVYDSPGDKPIQEHFALKPTNPYGQSKLMVEEVLRDLYASDDRWNIGILRYFNPVGAHESGMIGEDPNGIPNNLMPFISQVAVGRREALSVFGSDYPTHDGTGVRDYIHVVDLAKGHLAALDTLVKRHGLITVNLGTGQGYSVLDMVKAFESSTGLAIPYKLVDRRPGDVATCYANPAMAKEVLNWAAELDINAMCRDTWHWQSQNPQGYDT